MQFVLFQVLLDAPGGINEFLLSGEERMALRADFHAQVLDRTAGFDDVAAGTNDFRFVILRMDFLFHQFPSLSQNYHLYAIFGKMQAK